MINLWTNNYLQSQYSIFADLKLIRNLQNGAFQIETGHRVSSTLDQRSLTFTFDKLHDKRNDISKRKEWILSSENENHINMFPTTENSLSCCLLFVCSRKMKKSTPLGNEDCRFVCFETGLGKPILTLNDPNGLKIPQMFILSILTANGIALSNQHRKMKICQPVSRFSQYTRSTYGVRKTASATRMEVRT